MELEALRQYCMSLPHATEDIQWEKDLLFRVGGKMFAVYGLENGHIGFKCNPEEFGELTVVDGIIPAPYVARYHWINITRPNVLKSAELKRLIRKSYDLVYEKLPPKVKRELNTK